MKKLVALFLTFSLYGCVGLALGTYGTHEVEVTSAKITNERNDFNVITGTTVQNKRALFSAWGEPDSIDQVGNCEVVTYHDGYNWSGVGAFVLILPIPLLVPSGKAENRFYFVNGESVGVVREIGEVTGMLGYMCGSNECRFAAGPVKYGIIRLF